MNGDESHVGGITHEAPATRARTREAPILRARQAGVFQKTTYRMQDPCRTPRFDRPEGPGPKPRELGWKNFKINKPVAEQGMPAGGSLPRQAVRQTPLSLPP